MNPAVPSAPEFTLFVPCLNEEPRVAATLESVRLAMLQVGRSYEVLVYDDGSTDGTAQEVERYGAAHPEMDLHLHRNATNHGVAYSFVEAAFAGRGIYFRLIWGDNVETVETLVKILSLAGQADLVVPYYPHVEGKGRFRMAISNSYTTLVNLMSGNQLHYYNASMLCRRQHVMRWCPHNYGFTGFLADLITQLLAEGATCIEVPVHGSHVEKEAGGTPLTFHNFFSTGLTLFAIFSRRLSYRVYRAKLARLHARH